MHLYLNMKIFCMYVCMYVCISSWWYDGLYYECSVVAVRALSLGGRPSQQRVVLLGPPADPRESRLGREGPTGRSASDNFKVLLLLLTVYSLVYLFMYVHVHVLCTYE